MTRSLRGGAAICALLLASTPAVAGPASGYPSATTPYAGTESVLGSEPGPGFTTAVFPIHQVGLYALSLLSGDCTFNASNKIVCTQTNGSPFGSFATANAASPPAIGTTSPNTATFTALTASGPVTFSGVTGATQCLLVNSSGVLSASGANCLTPSTAVTSFNTRVGPVSLLSADVTGALTYTPAHNGANSDITSLSGLTTALSVGQGGVGGTTHTAHGLLLGEGTSPVSSTAAMSFGQVLVGQGATSDPTPVTISGDATLAANGALTVTASNGNTLTSAAWTPIGTSGAVIPLLSGINAYSGKQNFAVASASGAGVNIGQASTAPTTPVNGDLWTTPSGVFAQISGSTLQLGGSAFGVSSWTSPGGTVQTGAVTMQKADVTNALAYTPLNPASNLSDVANVATARTSLGLGTFATANAATPPAIGSTTPNSGAFTTLSATGSASAASFNGPLNGNVNGNASTASTWQNARTESLTGDVTGSAAFNGSSNWSIATAIQPGAVTAAKMASGAAVGNIGFTPLSPGANLEDLSNIPGARNNLGLGSLATAARASAYFSACSSSGCALYSGNGVSGVTRNSTGNYFVNFSASLPDGNYTVICTSGGASAAICVDGSCPNNGCSHLTNGVDVLFFNASNAAIDPAQGFNVLVIHN